MNKKEDSLLTQGEDRMAMMVMKKQMKRRKNKKKKIERGRVRETERGN